MRDPIRKKESIQPHLPWKYTYMSIGFAVMPYRFLILPNSSLQVYCSVMMHSILKFIVLLTLFLYNSCAYQDNVSTQKNFRRAPSPAPSKNSVHPHPIPSEYKCVYDRNKHSHNDVLRYAKHSSPVIKFAEVTSISHKSSDCKSKSLTSHEDSHSTFTSSTHKGTLTAKSSSHKTSSALKTLSPSKATSSSHSGVKSISSKSSSKPDSISKSTSISKTSSTFKESSSTTKAILTTSSTFAKSSSKPVSNTKSTCTLKTSSSSKGSFSTTKSSLTSTDKTSSLTSKSSSTTHSFSSKTQPTSSVSSKVTSSSIKTKTSTISSTSSIHSSPVASTSSDSSKKSTSVKTSSSSVSVSHTTSSHSKTTSSTSHSTSKPSCQPELQLNGVSETGFNPSDTPFSVDIISCSKFDVHNTTALFNFSPVQGVQITPDSIQFAGFDAYYSLLSIVALDTYGNAIFKSYQLHFGNVDMPVTILAPDGKPASGVQVYGNATAYPGVGQQCTTDASGTCTLTNLPPTTIGITAKGSNNEIAIDGLASTTATVTLNLLPYLQPSADSVFGTDNGTTGWTFQGTGYDSNGTLTGSGESEIGGGTNKFRIKRDTSLILSTADQYGLQSANYQFITEEIPGGFFGTQYNDYYSVTIRSDTGDSVTDTNSMNGLGLGAFDANGATGLFTLDLPLDPHTKSVEYDLGVSNVVDDLFQSELVVSKIAESDCDNCGDCTSCPIDPMCQDSCQNPPPKSCSFYRSCADAQLDCGPEGYPLRYGETNCNKFQNNIDFFSAAGQDFVWGTAHCLQEALVPVLEPCTATCPSLETAAFNSHPGCYVANGFCGLGCADIAYVLMTVGTDLVTSLDQVVQTAGLCLENIVETLKGCTGDVVTELVVDAAIVLFESAL